MYINKLDYDYYMKNIKIYFTRLEYIPFNLYISSIHDILTKSGFAVSIINNFREVTSDTDFLILFLNDINAVFDVNTGKTKVIFIHADYLLNHSEYDQTRIKTYIVQKNPSNTYIWEYSNLNIEYYNKNHRSIKWFYLPLMYNSYLEKIYDTSASVKIPYEQKKYDILFMGSQQARRMDILNILKMKYKVLVIEGISDMRKYVDAIENSKIVLNIYSKDTNKPFDHYRLAFLYSNRIMVINETMEHYNTDIEKNLIDLKNVMVNADYSQIEETVGRYLNMPAVDISVITEQVYNNFKSHDMSVYITNFFATLG